MSKINKIIITSLVHMLLPISLGFNASFYCSSSEQPEQTCLTGISSFLTSFLPRSFLSPTDPTKPESTDAALRIFCINNPDYSISSEGMSSPEVIDLLKPFKEYLDQISRDPNVKQSLDNYNSAVEKEIQSLDTFISNLKNISKLENGNSKYEATQVFDEFLGNLSNSNHSPASFNCFLFSANFATNFSLLISLAISDLLAIFLF